MVEKCGMVLWLRCVGWCDGGEVWYGVMVEMCGVVFSCVLVEICGMPVFVFVAI